MSRTTGPSLTSADDRSRDTYAHIWGPFELYDDRWEYGPTWHPITHESAHDNA